MPDVSPSGCGPAVARGRRPGLAVPPRVGLTGRGGLPGMACWEARRYAASAAAGQVAALRAARQREAPRAAAPVAAGQAAAVVQRWPDSGRCTMARDATRRRVLVIGAVTLPLAMAG